MNWLRRLATNSNPAPGHGRAQSVGLELTSSQLLGVAVGPGRVRPLMFDEPSESLPLVVNLEGRLLTIGRSGVANLRRRPHLAYRNFLPYLGQPEVKRVGRHALTANAALRLAFDAVRPLLEAESESVALALPAYLTTAQVAHAIDTAHAADWPLEGTVAAPLALAADRAAGILGLPRIHVESDAPVVMPLHPGSVLVIDADDHGVSGSVVAITRDRVELIASAVWPQLGLKAWYSRLIDAVADQCVRICRRDPRDSADAEQDLFEQLRIALDRLTPGQPVSLTLRTAQWYQVMVQLPEEFEAHCADLIRQAVRNVQDLLASVSLSSPPRFVWLTHAAGRLPGLAKALHANSAIHTSLEILPPRAVAGAAARLVPRWLGQELPRTHLDSELKLEVASMDNGEPLPRNRRAAGNAGESP